MRLKVRIPPDYPGTDPPKVEVSGFYEKYQGVIQDKLAERWSPGMLVLYDWY